MALATLAKQRADLPSATLRADLPPGIPEHLADDVYSKEILERANRLKQQSSHPQSGNDRRSSESLKEFSRLVYSSDLGGNDRGNLECLARARVEICSTIGSKYYQKLQKWRRKTKSLFGLD